MTRDEPEAALALARRAVDASPTSASALRLCAEISLDLGDAARARDLAAKALALGGGDLETLRVGAAAWRGDPKAAAYAERAERAAAASPSWMRGAALRLSERIWLDVPDEERALGTLRRALAEDPDDLDALLELVRLARGRRLDLAAPPAADAESTPAPGGLEALRREAASAKSKEEKRRAGERLLLAADEAPSWLQADAQRMLARVWLALGQREWAFGAALRAHDLDLSSLETARLMREHFSTLDTGWPATIKFGYGEVIQARLALGDRPAAEAALSRCAALIGAGCDDLKPLLESSHATPPEKAR